MGGYILGIFRIILAWFVVISHTKGYETIFSHNIDTGEIAVAVFFFISGFLMPLAFNSNYNFSNYAVRTKYYFINRFLRIYPYYWLSLFLALLQQGYRFFDSNRQLLDISQLVQNFLLVGLNQSYLWGSYYRLNNPAWTLDIELQYYILVPLIVLLWNYSFKIMLFLFVAFSLISLYLLRYPVDLVDIDRSLLAWFVLFIAGFLFYELKVSNLIPKIKARAVLLFIAITASYLSNSWNVVFAVLLIGLAAELLLLQKENRFSRIDVVLGELSYPVYIFHILVIPVSENVLLPLIGKKIDGLPLNNIPLNMAINCALSTVFAWVIWKIFERPIGNLRIKFKKVHL